MALRQKQSSVLMSSTLEAAAAMVTIVETLRLRVRGVPPYGLGGSPGGTPIWFEWKSRGVLPYGLGGSPGGVLPYGLGGSPWGILPYGLGGSPGGYSHMVWVGVPGGTPIWFGWEFLQSRK